MYDIYMFFDFSLNICMLHNPIITCICPLITCICPLIQDVANISMSLYTIVNLFFLKICTMFHRTLLQDVTHSTLPDTQHHVLPHSLPGVGLFEPHFIAHIFTIHWGLPSPPFLNPLSHPDTLACAAPATWAMSREGWLGVLDFVWWVLGLGLRYAMCRWRSIPWEWWNIIWHIQILSTKDLPTAW